jgi:hypothetical protein
MTIQINPGEENINKSLEIVDGNVLHDRIGIYHNADLDGICCAAIMKKKYPDILLIGMDHGDELPENPNHLPVILCDLSLPIHKIEKLAKSSNYEFLWIDHHVSTIRNYENLALLIKDCKPILQAQEKGSFRLVYDERCSACELTWFELFGVELTMPEAIIRIGDYDAHRREENEYRWNTETLPFQYGMRMLCKEVATFPAQLLDTTRDAIDLINTVMNSGRVLLKYEDSKNVVLMKKAFDVIYCGYTAICLNIPNGNENMFKSVYKESVYDLMITFCFDGGEWIITLFSNKKDVDCSHIVSRYSNSGGHKGAAGFRTKNFEDFIFDCSGPVMKGIKHQ